MDYLKELPHAAVTVSDIDGNVLYQNERSKVVNGDVVGKSMVGCHKPESWAKVLHMQATDTTNAYTIEKAGIKKLVYQAPWHEDGVVKGMVEFSIEIPFQMEHFVRSPPPAAAPSPAPQQ
eukprot:JZ549809.1.p2 GENE.JZ549809.1~~JZ549809.1.p2  ORF type:complete len:120 (+),score=21.68 JZ549809.1:30-389(+)